MPQTSFSARFSAHGFAPEVVSRHGSLSFTADDLAHALFVTGRAPADRWSHGAASVFEWLHRTSVVPAYVRRNTTGRLVRSRLALELDRSEKMAFSYALGQAATAIFCSEELEVSHLLHVDRYAAHHRVRFGSSRSRPDLFGPSPTGWVVAEAKGRSNAMESTLPSKLEAQKRSIKSIQGSAPAVALGCVASFPPEFGVMRVDAVDPVDNEPTAIDLDVDTDRFLLAYYAPFLAALDIGDRDRSGGGATVVSFGGIGVRVGLESRVHERVLRAVAGELAGLTSDLAEILATAIEPGEIFRDGTVIRTSWEDAFAVPDWEEG